MSKKKPAAPRRWRHEPITDERLATIFRALALNWGKGRKSQKKMLMTISRCLECSGTVPVQPGQS